MLGYNTNGFAHHTLEDSCAILAEIGYGSIALTVERDLLNSLDPAGIELAERLLPLLQSHQLRCTIETGSRFFLDPRRKHQPTLLNADPADRGTRIQFLQQCIDLASLVGAESVSLWSGVSDDTADTEVLWDRLLAGLGEVLEFARGKGVRLSFEPEPGMLIDTMEKFERLQERLSDPLFGLTLDVGHVHCMRDGDADEHIRRWRDKLWNVHIEDMRRGTHEHLMFGDGEMQFAPIFAALREIDYTGPVHVELSRHSHNAVEVARKSFEFLSRF